MSPPSVSGSPLQWGGVAGSRQKGKRSILPNSEVLLHQVMGGAEGQAVDIDIAARQIIKVKDRLNQIWPNTPAKISSRLKKTLTGIFSCRPRNQRATA